MTSVSLRGISKAFGGNSAVIELNFQVADGELWVLTGPSGSGKSTTLRLIAGLEVPDAGTIHFDSEEVTFRPAHRREAAVVFQTPGLFPHATVRRNMEAGLRPLFFRLPSWLGSEPSSGETRRQVDATARLLGMDRLLDRLPGELSGGERQRAALGRALVQRPKVLLLDEPLVHLDPELRFELRREIRRRQQADGITTVWVTHDAAEALATADRVGFLHKGRLLQTGTPVELYERPADVVIAKAFGPRPMNLVRGEWAEGKFRAGGWEQRCSLPAADGTEVTFGVRPEDLRWNSEGEVLGTGLVVGSEFAGDHCIVVIQFENDGPMWEVRAARDARPANGERVTVRLVKGREHWFANGGKRIEPGI